MNWTAKEELKYSWADRSRCTLGNKYSCWEKGSLRFLWWTTNTFAVLNHQLIFERCFLWVFEIKEKIYIFKESDHNKTRIAVKLLNSAVFEFTAHQICHCNAFCHNLHMRKVEQQQNTSGCRDKTFLTGKDLICSVDVRFLIRCDAFYQWMILDKCIGSFEFVRTDTHIIRP